ncbi:MAG TPA: outer membrane protein assembly factor BamD, partial [Gemmatimonadales bacterium]|nr:outer membrane protein assembly factor BamD [Gemmatimonadales bacterium]
MRTPRLRWMIGLALVACHGAPPGPPTPATMLERARQDLHKGDFSAALEAYKRLAFELQANDPAQPEVHYYQAECQYQTGDYIEAAHAFRETADRFPTSEFAPLALLRAGDANMRLWRRPELDATYGQTALATFQELAARYPDSEAAARANLHVKKLRAQFAEKAYKNGMFYYRRGAYDSGIIYFKDVIASYWDTPRAKDALLRLADTYHAIGYVEDLRETCTRLRQYYAQ